MPGPREGIYRDMIAAFNERDVERFLGFCDPTVEYHALMAGMGGIYRGHDGMRDWFADLAETLEPMLEILRVDEDGDVLVSAGHARGVGIGSGLELEWDYFQGLRYAGELVVWGITTTEEEAARAALGIA